MRKIVLSSILSVSLLAGCAAPATTSMSAAQHQNVQSFYGSLSMANDGTLHQGANNLFSATEFESADSDRDGRLGKPEMESFFKAQVNPDLKLSVNELGLDPESLVAIGLSGGVLAGYLAFVGTKISSEIMHPTKKAPGFPGTDTVVSDGLNLSVTYTPASVTTDNSIILCHPLGSSKEAMAEYATFLKGYNVLALDFRNHGASSGKDTTGGLNEAHDVLAAVSFLKSHGSKHIGVLGVGMGAVAGIDAAASSKDINAVVADTSYASLSDECTVRATSHHYPLASMVGRAAVAVLSLRTRSLIGKGDASANVANMKAPSLFIQATGNGGSLQAAAPQPSLVWAVDASKTESRPYHLNKTTYETKVLEHFAHAFDPNR